MRPRLPPRCVTATRRLVLRLASLAQHTGGGNRARRPSREAAKAESLEPSAGDTRRKRRVVPEVGIEPTRAVKPTGF